MYLFFKELLIFYVIPTPEKLFYLICMGKLILHLLIARSELYIENELFSCPGSHTSCLDVETKIGFSSSNSCILSY